MLNVMEERDIQIRGYVLRLPLDVLVVASANPEDYTNRGRIITPLKDRFGAEIRTHYPVELDDEVAVIRQEAHLVADGAGLPGRDPGPVHPQPARVQRGRPALRASAPGSRSPAPRRSPPRRCTGRPRQGEDEAVARVVDLETAVDVLGGKIEFESGEEGRERRDPRPPAAHRDRRDRARTTSAGSTSRCSSTRSRAARWSPPASRSPRATSSPGCRCWASPSCTTTCATGSTPPTTAQRAGAIELALEGLYLARKISKETGATARRSMAERPSQARSAVPLRPLRRRPGPARAAGRPRRGAGRDRRGRDGRLLARAGDAGVPAPRRAATRPASTTWPAGSPSGAGSCCSGTTSTAPCRRSASCSTARCSRSASSWPATSTWTTPTARSARCSSRTCRPRPRPRSAS